MGPDGEHIWLRQSATFTVNGETRTLEIALPLRPGATAEEIEALLREADGGMTRLARHLDARVAALRGDALPASETPPAAAPEAPAPARPLAAPVEQDVVPATPPARDSGARHAAPPPAAQPTEPAATIAALRERTGLSLVREPPAPSQPAPPREAASASDSQPGTPLTLQEFLKESLDEFGYTPKVVMEKLGVRSLSGVNYREALETLRRQALREGSGAPPRETTRGSASEPPARTPSPTPQSPRYFEEELDEPEILFGTDEDDDDALPPGYGLEEDDADEILDALEPEEAIAPPPAPRSTASTRARPSAQSQATTNTPPATAHGDAEGGERAQLAELIAQLRSPQAGGVPSSHQRTAFRNIVVQELGDEKAKALVAGLYRVTPERLGPEQIDALLSWGKRDTFADDAERVLGSLRAERAAQQANKSGADQPTQRTSRAPRG